MPRFFRIGALRQMAAGAAAVAIATAAVAASAAGDDRAAAETLLKEVGDSPRKDVATELTTRSRGALQRADKLRSSGDEAHAKLADRLARTWAEAARDVVRAAVVEENAGMARRGLVDAGALADRERALLEEAIAQSGRLRAQLDAAEREGKDQPARTSTAAVADAGAKKPAAPPKNGGATAKDGGATAPPTLSGPTVKDGTSATAKDGGAQ